MKNPELVVANLSIKNFCSLFSSIETTYEEDYDGAIAKIAPICDTTIEEIEDLDLNEVKSLAKQLEKLDLQSLVNAKPQFEFELNDIKYIVNRLEDGSLNLKFNENKYLRSILTSDSPSYKLFYDNLDKIASVLFKPQGELKFDVLQIEERAKLFKECMPAKIIYPHIDLLVKKLS